MFKISKKVKLIAPVLLIVLVGFGILIPKLIANANSQQITTQDVTSKSVDAQVKLGGSVIGKSQEVLHFNVGGKVTLLPFQPGDSVKKGDVIASLDTQALSIALQQALNNQKTAQASLEKTLDDIHLFQYGNGGFNNVGSANETETQKSQRVAAQEAAGNADEAVKAAQRNFQDAQIISPIDGTLVGEDITNTGVNVSTTTSFTVADLTHLLFETQVPDSDIDFVHVGDNVQIKLDSGQNQVFSGTVSQIYPEKVAISSGGSGYKVDVESPDLANSGKFGATGSILVQPSSNGTITSAPAWTVLGHQYIWVLDGNSPKLIQVTVGETRGGWTEILSGISANQQVIINPQSLIKKNYLIQ